jgi:hypothetical protein
MPKDSRPQASVTRKDGQNVQWYVMVALMFAGLLCTSGYSQNPSVYRPKVRDAFPPDIFQNTRLDIIKLDPKHYRIDYENEQVRIVRAELKPDEVSPLHDDVQSVLICPVECHIRFTRADGKLQDVHLDAGETRWIYEDTRSHKNLSTKPAVLIFVEIKAKNEPAK